ncbi:MAG: EAL domain-containing protein [Sideroxydans sp.]
MTIQFNSLRTRLTVALLLMVILPILTIGWMAYDSMVETVRSERIKAVGNIADSKHDQLLMVLTRANIRTEHFLSDLNAQCGANPVGLNRRCAANLIRTYLATEGATGANLRSKEGDDLTVGSSAVQNKELVTFQAGQLAELSGTGPESNQSYFIEVGDRLAGFRLYITYPSSTLESVFNPPPADLGLSGETFLADGEGYFVTQPRYASEQWGGTRISTPQMQACLNGKNGESLGWDYRDIAIIHSFRFIPEFGAACLKVNIIQDEAFAPIKVLQQKIMIALFLFGAILVMLAVLLARSIVKPITRLTHVTRSIAAGDDMARADTTGHDEISELATSFNLMTNRLHQSREDLHRLLNSMIEGVYGMDTEGNCTFVNQSFLRMLGYQNEAELMGKHIHELIHHSHADGSPCLSAECKIYRTYQTNRAANVSDEVFWRKDGVAIPVEYWSHPIISGGVVTGAIATFVDITERKKAEEDISRLAFYDPLTSLPNRRLLLDRLQHALANSARSGKHGAIMFIDLDNFKVINDTKGHDCGDLILIEVARCLQSCVREGDTVARLGGDEFVVMLEDMDSDAEHAATQAEEVGEKIRAAINQPYLIRGEQYRSTASIGISLFVNRDTTSDILLKNADIAMYQAKGAGRNAVRFFDPKMQAVLETHTSMEADLQYALAKRQFQLYYQAQVDETGRIYGAEALIRWMHPQRGMTLPDQFIAIAEESSLILDIGQWVLETACAQLAFWGQDEQTSNLTIAVNVSARQFKADDFVDRVAAVIRKHHINPSLLKLELTESMVLHDVTDITTKMHSVKALGVGLSMDDFGTGYSSLSHLKQLPLDQLKIDRSFVRDIATDSGDAIMVRTIIDMAHNFRLNVIAEGVENEAQQDFLKQHDCLAYQGFLFSKPVPVEEFEQLLHTAGDSGIPPGASHG